MARPSKLPPGMWKRGDTYYARFRANGRLIRKRLSTNLEAAKQLLNELRARADRAEFGITDNDYAWDDLKREFLRWARQSVRNPGDYERDLRQFEAYQRVRSINLVDSEYVLGFREWRLAGGGSKDGKVVLPRTVNREVCTLKNMLNKGVIWCRIATNAVADLKPLHHENPAKTRRSLTIEEVQALFDASPDHLRPIWRMFMTTGIRRSELRNMRFRDVDFESKAVTVRADIAKNHKSREIPLDDEMLAIISKLKADAATRKPMPGLTSKVTEQQHENFSREHVFVTRANTPWKNNLLRAFYGVCRRAGIAGADHGGDIDLHSLRVSFATLSIENGAAPKAVQEILGHSSLALTMGVYARATERSKRDVINSLPFASAIGPKHVISMQNAHKARTSPKSKAQDEADKALSDAS